MCEKFNYLRHKCAESVNKHFVFMNIFQTNNCNFAVSNKNEIVEMFHQKKLSQLSTIEEEQALKVFQGDIKKSKIQSFTLDAILEKKNLP